MTLGIIVVSLITVFLLLLGVAWRVGWKLTHPPRKPLDATPEQYGLRVYDDVSFPSREADILLSGWYIPAAANGADPNGHTLIFSHGYSQNRLEPHLPALALASRLVRKGYDVLMYDFRNAGKSGGNATTVGWKEQEDLLGAIDFVAERYPDRQISLIGFSMGAVTSLLAAGRDSRVRAVVADSPFSCLYEYLAESLPRWTGLPRIPFNWLFLNIIPLMYRANPREVRPYEAVKRMKDRPLLLIHGEKDKTVGFHHSEKLYALLEGQPSARLWLVPEAGHVRCFATCPDEYTEVVVQFLRDHLLTKKITYPNHSLSTQ